MTARNNNLQKGFTLIELLVVIGILAVLLAITLIAINPARQFAQANNTKRNSDVKQILNAVGAYVADNKGVTPSQIPVGTASAISSTGVNICAILVPEYIPALPADPSATDPSDVEEVTPGDCGTYDTGYTIRRDASGRITVLAPLTELTPEVPIIQFTR